MEEKKILLLLPYGELSVAAIKEELSNRQVRPANNRMLKADLSELLRMNLEKTQTLGSLIELRSYEIDAIQYARWDTLLARLRSRGLVPEHHRFGREDRGVLLRRLGNVLLKEKADFEQQNKENIPPIQDKDEKPMGNDGNDDKDDHQGYKPAAAITPEQRRRMERNRKRALELQAEKRQEKEKHQRRSPQEAPRSSSSVVSITPIRAPPPAGPSLVAAAGVPDEMTGHDNICGPPFAFDYCTPVKAETSTSHKRLLVNPYATLKRTGIATPPQAGRMTNLYSPVAHTKLHPNHSARPTSTSSPPAIVRQMLAPCSRCGDSSGKQGLCIVWNHSGDIQRESWITTTASGVDQFRWDCCGRLDGQPCFVGVHSRPCGSSSSGQPPGCSGTTISVGGGERSANMVMCNCQEVALLRRTRKPTSPNRGRYFFCCFSKNCKFFRWADEAYGLSKDVPLVSPDGVREWEIPFANPFGEQYGHLTTAHPETESSHRPQQQQRKRLVAALLLQEMCISVKGQGGLNCNGLCSKELATSVLHTVHNGGDTILWKLQPLTSDQLSRRFGWPKSVSLVGLDQKECEAVLLDMLENSQWIKSIGIRYQHGVLGESSVFVDLAGLEGYLDA